MTSWVFLPKISSVPWQGWVLDTCIVPWAKIITPFLSYTLVCVLKLPVKKLRTESSRVLAWAPEAQLVPFLVLPTSDWRVCLMPQIMMLALTYLDILQSPAFTHYHGSSVPTEFHPSSMKPRECSADSSMPFVCCHSHWSSSLVIEASFSFPQAPIANS